VARVTVMAMTQGLALGRHVSWKVMVAAAKRCVLLAADFVGADVSQGNRLAGSGGGFSWLWR
jgi:hypothetical protein